VLCTAERWAGDWTGLEKENGRSRKIPVMFRPKDIQYIILRCLEFVKWRKILLSKKWLKGLESSAQKS
jgi:hypothetical protein